MEDIIATNKKQEAIDNISNIIARVCTWFLSTAFILWGWNVLAPHLNAPLFDYWEIFAMRMAFSSFCSIVRYKN
jgi:hypothetical protein